MMENSADEKPDMSMYWMSVEKKAGEIEAKDKLKAAQVRRSLTLEIFDGFMENKDVRSDWDFCMPIPYKLCKEVVESAKVLDRKRIKAKLFSSYEMNQAEEDLVDMLISYGQALGVEEVVHEIKRQAVQYGCTKSQKMYLDYIAGIDLDQEDDGSVHLNISLVGDDSQKKDRDEKVVNVVE